MKIIKTTVANQKGLHLHVACLIVKTVGRFHSEVRLANGENGRRRDARSVLDITSEASPRGTVVLIEAEGPDEAEAADTIRRVIEVDFGRD